MSRACDLARRASSGIETATDAQATDTDVTALPYESTWAADHAGPARSTGDWRRFWHLTFNIAVMQWKLRFFGSALGYAVAAR